MASPTRGPRDWQSLYEQAHARAETGRTRAAARAEELLQAERAARSRAGSLKWQLDRSRDKLKAAVEETKEVRRAAKDALFYQAEVTRLEKLLSQAGVESSRRSTIMSLRMEVFGLREALQASEARKDATVPLRPERRPAAAQGCADAEDGEGHDRAAVEGERPAAQGAGALAGAEGRARGVAQEGRGASQVETSGTGLAAPRERPAAQGAGTDAEAEGHDQGAARGSRFPEPGDPSAEPGEWPAAPRAGAVAGSQEGSTQAVRRGQAAAWGAGGIPRPDGPHRFADEARRLSGNCPEEVRHREGGGGGRACRSSPAARGLQEIARPGQDHRVAAQGERTAGQGDQGCCGLGTREWKPGLPSFVRPGPCCRRRSTAARARSRTRRARSASEASNAALPGTAAPSGRRSRRRRNGTIRRRTRASVPVAGSPMSPMASFPRPSSRSRSRPTSAESSVPATAGVATVRPRPWRWRRRRCHGCSPGRPMGPPSGRASSSSALPASGPCVVSRRGWRTRGWQSRRGRWPAACPASCRCSNPSPRRSSRTRTRWRCATATRPAGASSR